MATGPASIEIGNHTPTGETKIRRSYMSPDRLVESPSPEISILSDVLDHAAKERPTLNGIGWRDVIRIHKETKPVTKIVGGKEVQEDKTWEFYELSDYKYWTYEQFQSEVSLISSGLAELGLKKQHTFNIYSATKPAWQVLANGKKKISSTQADLKRAL